MNNGVAGFLCLAFISVAYISGAAGLERLRLTVSHRKVATMLGVFTFAGVVDLPLYLLGVLVLLIYAAAWPTERRAGRKLHRWAYTAGSVVLACLIASVLLHHLPEAAGVPAGLILFTAINGSLIALAISAAGHSGAWTMFRSREFYAVLGSTLPIGAVIGVGMQHIHPLVGTACLPITVGLHYRTARRTAEEAGALFESLWTREAWLVQAEEVERTDKCYSAMVIDLDDAEAVAATAELAADWFAGCPIGRYSDRQLAILLVGQVHASATALGTRLAMLLADMDIAAGVGVADNERASLSEVLLIAESCAIVDGSATRHDSESELR